MNDITLVTGGAGFVGKHLVGALRARGEKTRSFDLAEPVHVDDMQGSITDKDAVARVMAGVKSVFHLAGNAQLWAKDGAVFDNINRHGTEVVATAAHEAGARMVYCSSLTTLVGKSTPIGPSRADEDTHLDPEEMLGPYPRSKLFAERRVLEEVKRGLDAVIALPTEPLGPCDDSLTPPTQMILDFANGKTPAYIDCVLNFVPVESLAEGLIAARDRGRRGQRYLLGGENTPLKDLLVRIAEISGRPAPKTKMPYWVALMAGAVDTSIVSAVTQKSPKAPLTGVRLAGRQVSFFSEKAARELQWRAAPMEPALKAMLDWAQDKQLLKPV
ncbi:MAG: hypothetical protein CMI63_20400 [Parvularcula sp.]|nr:hypothetical protein [Parvularcula sp.]